MSTSLGPALPPDLLAWLGQGDLAARLGRVLPLVTVDAEGRPHPMLLSYVEVLAADARTLRIAIGAGSRSARNLDERGAATLLVIEPERTVYVKCRSGARRLARGELARFDLRVEDVLEDRAAEWEAHTHITSGPSYAPVPALAGPVAQATLALLRADLGP